MTRDPKIPRTPGEVPQQRLIPLVSLSQRPPSFHGKCDFIDPMPDEVRPKGSPRNTTYLGSVEWAWSPGNSRFDSYYLNPRGKFWLLWIRWQSDNDWNQSWKWALYAYSVKKRADEKTAAIFLLQDAWKAEAKEQGLDHYFLIDEPGLLSVAEFSEIARKVWPQS